MNPEALTACLIAVDAPLQHIAAVQLSSEQATAIRYGQAIDFANLAQGTVRLYHDDLFLGLGEMTLNGKLAPKKLFNLTD